MFFFSGGCEDEYLGEKCILILLLNVVIYDFKLEMSVYEVIDELVVVINFGEFDLLVVNYVNGDMVGYMGVFNVVVKVVEVVDLCLGCVYEVVMV